MFTGIVCKQSNYLLQEPALLLLSGDVPLGCQMLLYKAIDATRSASLMVRSQWRSDSMEVPRGTGIRETPILVVGCIKTGMLFQFCYLSV